VETKRRGGGQLEHFVSYLIYSIKDNILGSPPN